MHLPDVLSLATLVSLSLGNPIVPIIEPAIVYRDTSSHLLNTTTLQTRSAGSPGYYYCTEPFWQGVCGWNPLNAPMTWLTGWSGSFGPDHGVVCKIYDDVVCESSNVGAVRYPGIADLSTDHLLRSVLVNGPHCVSCEKDYV